MRKFLIGFLVGYMVMLTTPALAESLLTKIDVVLNSVEVQVNGEKLDVNTILYDGSTYLPMRKIAEAVGKDVAWNSETMTANIVEKEVLEKGNDNNMENEITNFEIIERDNMGISIIRLNKEEYYAFRRILYLTLQYDKSLVIKTPGAGYEQDFKMSLCRYLENGDSEVLIDSIPYKIYELDTYISKDYYENTILPLIKK